MTNFRGQGLKDSLPIFDSGNQSPCVAGIDLYAESGYEYFSEGARAVPSAKCRNLGSRA